MIRIGLSLYLALVMLAGPWFCCCTTLRLLNALVPTPEEESAPPCSCCQNHQETSHDQQKDVPEEPTCSCHDEHFNWALISASRSLLPMMMEPTDKPGENPYLFSVPIGSLPLVSSARQDPPILPFVTTDDLLHHLHILRC